jgi:hypothetical protein
MGVNKAKLKSSSSGSMFGALAAPPWAMVVKSLESETSVKWGFKKAPSNT